MWWLINTALASRRAGKALLLGCLLASTGWAQTEWRPPSSIVAGSSFSIPTSGSGSATFYLLGPGTSSRQSVRLGQEIQISDDDVDSAGQYLGILCADTCRSAQFFVTPAEPASLGFLAHPSRVPVGQQDAISGVAFPFDKFQNLILAPVTVDFQITSDKAQLMSKSVLTRNGAAWFRAASGPHAGVATLSASVKPASSSRVVRLVASDPCNLRIKAQRTKSGILVETEPVRDCAGNPVPDGTIVTFTGTSASGKATVDAPIKQGVARAEILGAGSALVSVASGVVMGNELHVESQ